MGDQCLAAVLTENSCFDQVFFANSGAEANEGAIKLARKFGALHRNGVCELAPYGALREKRGQRESRGAGALGPRWRMARSHSETERRRGPKMLGSVASASMRAEG